MNSGRSYLITAVSISNFVKEVRYYILTKLMPHQSKTDLLRHMKQNMSLIGYMIVEQNPFFNGVMRKSKRS